MPRSALLETLLGVVLFLLISAAAALPFGAASIAEGKMIPIIILLVAMFSIWTGMTFGYIGNVFARGEFIPLCYGVTAVMSVEGIIALAVGFIWLYQ